MPNFRKGAEGVADAQKKAKSGGQFSPFAPELFWKGDGDEKYLLFLNPMAEIPTVEMISFIPVTRKKGNGEKFTTYERVIARTDAAIGEDSDPMVDDWDGKPRDTCVAVAVELEPTLEKGANGRMRPVGFHIKTDSYERRVRDDDGELTDETEEVDTPVIGFIQGSPHNMFNVIASADANDFEIESTAVKIVRVGSDTSTTYTVTGYQDAPIDLNDLVQYIEGVSYLDDEEMDALVEAIDDVNGDIGGDEAGLIIGQVLLDKRMAELCDEERYNKLYDGITETLDKFSGKGKKGGKAKPSASKRERPARRSSRRSTETVEPQAEHDEDQVAAEPEAEEEAPKPRARRSRAKAKEEEAPAEEKPKARRSRAAKPKEEAAEPVPSQQDPEKMGKLDRLRKRNAEQAEKATA